MKCPSCIAGDRVEILESRLSADEQRVRRRRACGACGHRWTTIEAEVDLVTGKVKWAGANATGSVRSSAARTTGSARVDKPPATRSANPPPVVAGGVGGGLSSGSVRGPISDPSLSNSTLDRRAPAPIPFKSRPRVHVGAATREFMRVYGRYPNKYRMQQAAQVWQDLVALPWPGGEKALADEIVAAFDAGMLARHPYSAPQRHRPKLEDVLAEFRWQEPESAPDAAPLAAAGPGYRVL